jgi:hypothetical protein
MSQFNSTTSFLDIFPNEIMNEITSHMDLQTLGRFAQVSSSTNILSDYQLNQKRETTLKNFVKKYRAILVKRISPDTALMIHPFIFESTFYNQDDKIFNIHRFGHYELNLNTSVKRLIKKSEFIQKAYPKL